MKSSTLSNKEDTYTVFILINATLLTFTDDIFQ